MESPNYSSHLVGISRNKVKNFGFLLLIVVFSLLILISILRCWGFILFFRFVNTFGGKLLGSEGFQIQKILNGDFGLGSELFIVPIVHVIQQGVGQVDQYYDENIETDEVFFTVVIIFL